MKKLTLRIERCPYTAQTTSGKLYMIYDDRKDYFCFTLEDTARPSNIKVYSDTCIPEGVYKVGLFENAHYKKTLIIYNETDGVTIKVGALKWEGCLFHNGTNHLHTAGCVLVGKTRVNNDTITGGMKDELRIFVERKMKEGYEVYAEFINLTQTT